MCRYVSHLSCIIFVLAAVSFFTAAVSAHDAGFDGRAAVGGGNFPIVRYRPVGERVPRFSGRDAGLCQRRKPGGEKYHFYAELCWWLPGSPDDKRLVRLTDFHDRANMVLANKSSLLGVNGRNLRGIVVGVVWVKENDSAACFDYVRIIDDKQSAAVANANDRCCLQLMFFLGCLPARRALIAATCLFGPSMKWRGFVICCR